jgi:hypothetical protein
MKFGQVVRWNGYKGVVIGQQLVKLDVIPAYLVAFNFPKHERGQTDEDLTAKIIRFREVFNCHFGNVVNRIISESELEKIND